LNGSRFASLLTDAPGDRLGFGCAGRVVHGDGEASSCGQPGGRRSDAATGPSDDDGAGFAFVHVFGNQTKILNRKARKAFAKFAKNTKSNSPVKSFA
jgi:hypothetical protein